MMNYTKLVVAVFLAFLLTLKSSAQAANANPVEGALTKNETDGIFRLSPGDTVTVTVVGEPEMSSTQRLDSFGKLRLPLIEELKLAGLTTREAESYLVNVYRQQELMKDAQVRVDVSGSGGRQILVTGSVASPGVFQFPPETTSVDITDVVTRMGGFKAVAKGSAVKVIRPVPDGKEEIYTVDVDSMFSGKNSGDSARKRFQLFPGDRVNVEQRLF